MCPENLNYGKEIAILDLTSSSYAERRMACLREGKAVAFKLNEVSMTVPKRYPFPVLLIVPSEAVGLDGGLFISIAGLRSEYVPRDALTTGGLVRVGLTRRASKMLIDALKRIYEVENNGRKKG